jgi:putative transposase
MAGKEEETMVTPKRVDAGDMVYHVLNRANGRIPLFEKDGDYLAFRQVMREANEQTPMRTLAFCLMPNHWHLILWPENDGALSHYMHWLTTTHTKRWHAHHETTGSGHVYQGPFKSFPVESDPHYFTVCRYVERNALRAGLAPRAEAWRWGSLWTRLNGDAEQRSLLSDGPMPWPDNWLELVNEPQSPQEEEALQRCMQKGMPYGDPAWIDMTTRALGLTARYRQRGRPPLPA